MQKNAYLGALVAAGVRPQLGSRAAAEGAVAALTHGAPTALGAAEAPPSSLVHTVLPVPIWQQVVQAKVSRMAYMQNDYRRTLSPLKTEIATTLIGLPRC